MGRLIGLAVLAFGVYAAIFPPADGGGGLATSAAKAYALTEAEGETAGVVADNTFGSASADEVTPEPRNDKSQILMFTGGPSCPACQRQEKELTQVKRYMVGVAEGADIRKLRTDDATIGAPLAKKYGVDQVPTFVILDKAGNQKARYVGVQSAAYLEQLLDAERQPKAVPKQEQPKVVPRAESWRSVPVVRQRWFRS